MSDEELAPPDWRVRAGPRNKPIQKEREEHEATHVPSRDWCTHCMMGRRRTQAHVPKRKSEDPSRRPAIAMESVVNAQTISQESATCIAVKDVRHQNIMSSVALKERVEEPWTIERVAKLIDLVFGYREITLNSDTEPVIIAFINRVADMCNTEVAT